MAGPPTLQPVLATGGSVAAAARVEASRSLEGSRDRGFSLDDFLVYMVNKEITGKWWFTPVMVAFIGFSGQILFK